MHTYTEEQRQFIRDNATGLSVKELTEKFNKHFNLNLLEKQIHAYKKNNKIRSGVDARFPKGNVPYNKGTKGVSKPNRGSFKKGNIPHSHLPIGSEVINSEGYWVVKVADPNKWKFKHKLIWEKHNGKISKGYCVLFGDRDRSNLDIDNLICVSRSQLTVMNLNGLIQDDADCTRTGAIVAEIKLKIGERKRSVNK